MIAFRACPETSHEPKGLNLEISQGKFEVRSRVSTGRKFNAGWFSKAGLAGQARFSDRL